MVIITDGHDNVRSEFKPEAINKMITTLQNENGWHFLFLAANQDAITTGSKLGVRMSNSMSYSASGAGIASTFQSAGSNIKKYRSGKAELFAKLSCNDMMNYKGGGMQGLQGMAGAQGPCGTQGVIGSLEFMADQRESAMEEKTVIKETKETIITKKTN